MIKLYILLQIRNEIYMSNLCTKREIKQNIILREYDILNKHKDLDLYLKITKM